MGGGGGLGGIVNSTIFGSNNPIMNGIKKIGQDMQNNSSADFAASVINPSTLEQANAQYGNVQQGLTNQADFLKAVQAQGGLQNQTNVFNQMQGVANGTGPNPAQAMLANSTGANITNQAAMMAAQRGSGANAGLMARQASMMGGNLQQQAAGQGAALQAQQSLNALNQMGGIATNQANQQANATNAYTNAAQAANQQVLNSIAGQNNTAVGMQSNVNNNNNTKAEGNANRTSNLVGNVMSGIGSAFGLANGGIVPMYAFGTGQVAMPDEFTPAPMPVAPADDGTTALVQTQGATTQGPKSSFGQSLKDFDEAISGSAKAGMEGTAKSGQAIGKGLGSLMKGFMANGGQVPAMVSPGEVYIPPQDLKKVKQGADPIKAGEKIPGKPKYPGNDYRNDVVPKTLEAGGLVIPNEVLQSKDPHKAAADFVKAHLAQRGKK